jgi:membrane protease YdiL (CAAX protease family)
MQITTNNPLDSPRPKPLYFLIILVLMFFAGMFIGQFLGLLISILTTDLKLNDVPELLSLPFTEEKRVSILLLQGLGALGGFIIAGILYLVIVERIQLSSIFNLKHISIWALILSVIAVISFMFVNTVFIEWNMNLSFPGFLNNFEDWAREKEEELRIVTEFLTEFSSLNQFIIVFIVVAIIPAIGEELIFRGILQNKFHLYFKNIHVAIIVTAILFSGFHLQFFGFVPRLFLGILFGYIYYWSGNLWYPILGHFINNGFTLILIYLFQTGYIRLDIETQEAYPLNIILIFSVITIYMLFSFWKQFQLQKEENE